MNDYSKTFTSWFAESVNLNDCSALAEAHSNLRAITCWYSLPLAFRVSVLFSVIIFNLIIVWAGIYFLIKLRRTKKFKERKPMSDVIIKTLSSSESRSYDVNESHTSWPSLNDKSSTLIAPWWETKLKTQKVPLLNLNSVDDEGNVTQELSDRIQTATKTAKNIEVNSRTSKKDIFPFGKPTWVRKEAEIETSSNESSEFEDRSR